MTLAAADVRFTVPLYSSREAAGYLGVSATTFTTWVRGYERHFPDRPTVTGSPLITDLPAGSRQGPTTPFGGLAEGMFLSALRKAGMPMQQIRPALDLVRSRLGIEHALASKRLYLQGATLLWEVSDDSDVGDEVRQNARDMIVLKDDQYVFRQVIQDHLARITYDFEYATRLALPRYEVALIETDPEINFGKPYSAHTGTPISVVRDMLRAGESVPDVADDFAIPIDELTDFAHTERLLSP